MTQTYLVPQKIAENIAAEQFNKTIELKVQNFFNEIKKTKEYTDELALQIAIAKGKYSDIFKATSTKVEKLRSIITLLLEQEPDTSYQLISALFNNFAINNYFGSKEALLKFDFDKYLSDAKERYDNMAKNDAVIRTEGKFQLAGWNTSTIINDMQARMANRVRMSKIESYDNIVKKVLAKSDIDAEIAEIYEILVELNSQ